MRKTHWIHIISLVILLLAFVCVVPFLIVLLGSLWSEGQFSVRAYYDVFLASPQYLYRFWKSMGLGIGIVIGQIIVSIMAGYGFAKCKFPGRNIIYFFLMILMILPIQVTLVPNYIMLDKLQMLGTAKALIFPAIFLPFGALLMNQGFKSVSDEIIDQAKVDGCNLAETILLIAVPMCKGSVICVGILSFLDAWNMVEQPIAYLKDFEQYPLAVALAYTSPDYSMCQFACCLLALLPPLALFAFFSKELVEGIVFGEEK